MATIRCHTVPQFYLNYFLQPGSSLLWVYDKKDSDTRPQSPINTTVIGDYYLSEPDDKGEKDKRAEEFFSVIENWAKPILDKLIITPTSLGENGKDVLAMFIAFTFCRSPRSVEAIKEIDKAGAEYALNQVMELAKDSGEIKKLYEKFSKKEENGTRLSYEEFANIVADPGKGVYVEINEKHAIGESLLLAEVIHRKIMDLHWHICVAARNHFFITSDAPVTIFTPFPNNRAIFGGGLGMPTVQVTFPLSPRLCLHLSHRPSEIIKHVDARYINEINRRTVYMAERFIISPFCSNRIKRLAQNCSTNYNTPKIDAEAIKSMLKEREINPQEKLK